MILDDTNTDHFVGRLMFKESPFYTILEPLTPTVECQGKRVPIS